MGKTGIQYRPRLSDEQYRRHLEMEAWKNILVVGDLHAPWIKEGYLEHCIEQRDRFACDKVVFIGDIVDNHYSSYHEQDPDGYGAGDELDRAIDAIKPWYEAFPDAIVTLGNHDLIMMRKAFSSGLSKRWIKGLDEVLGVPGWNFVEDVIINGVLYTHGTGQTGEKAAFNRALHRRMSVVMGHTHTVANVLWSASDYDRIFGMQVGCGIDESAYAFQYGKTFPKKMIISCAVVLNSGKLPIVIPMDM
jgi:predicted phosphodiesterase